MGDGPGGGMFFPASRPLLCRARGDRVWGDGFREEQAGGDGGKGAAARRRRACAHRQPHPKSVSARCNDRQAEDLGSFWFFPAVCFRFLSAKEKN
jgi:hypothetical protein